MHNTAGNIYNTFVNIYTNRYTVDTVSIDRFYSAFSKTKQYCGSGFNGVPGSGFAIRSRTRIKEGKNDPQK